MWVALFRSLVAGTLEALIIFLQVVLGALSGLLLGMFAARCITELGLGPPARACGLAGLLLLPAPAAGVLAGALGALFDRIAKGLLIGTLTIGSAALLLGLSTVLIGNGDAITRGSTIAVAGILIGSTAGSLGGAFGALLSHITRRIPWRV